MVLTPSPKRRKPLFRENSQIWGYIFILPNFLAFVVFMIIPIITSLYLSFSEWDLLTDPKWVGVSNYVKLVTRDRLFMSSLINTLMYSVYTIPLGICVSLCLALALNSRLVRGRTFFRAVFFLPHVCTMAAVALVWKWFYNAEFGILNYLLGLVGIPGQKWLTNRQLALPSIALMAVWKSAGYNMVIILAGLQGIPGFLFEAAELDGAVGFKRFRNITFPLLTPTLFFILRAC